MPLHRKWRSMDFFGSHESLTSKDESQQQQPHHHHRHHHHRLSARDAQHHHHHSLLHLKNPFRHRLSNSGSKEDNSTLPRKDKKEEGEPPDGETTLIQRCVIIQKDERGYGFTVSGDNPVYVASVKSEGAASRSGVQQGDRILKVNGTLVTNRNHLDVVKLIKSGSYVALTLLGKPNQAHAHTPLNSNLGTVPAKISNPIVTAPRPVNPDKDRELWQQKVLMTKAMYEAALEDYQKLQRVYAKNPSDKLQAQLSEKERTVKALENQLHNLKSDTEDAGASLGPNARPNRHSDSEHGSLDSITAAQSWQQQQRRDSGPDLRHGHIKQRSVPSLLYQGQGAAEARTSGASVARSKSDATSRKTSRPTSTFYVSRQSSANTSEWKSFTPSLLDRSSPRLSRDDRRESPDSFHPASSLPITTTNTSDLGSMSDSPQTSPSISPTPNDANVRHNGQDEDSTLNTGPPEIITIDDEDINLGYSPPTDMRQTSSHWPFSPFIARITAPEVNDPGPFVDIGRLEQKPAHMAVLLSYLIFNTDPSQVLFHIISDAYSRTPGSSKELRKWAYEIHSTFVVSQSPLDIEVDANTIKQIDDTLELDTKAENEGALRNIFSACRKAIQGKIGELLADFLSKKDLGMGNFYGFQKIDPGMDHAAEIRAAEEILVPILNNSGGEEAPHVISDRDQAINWAVATVLRLNSTGSSKSQHHHVPVLDKFQYFLEKDAKQRKFFRSNKAKGVKGHQFNLHHFTSCTPCRFCDGNIWGVGYQGYQCQYCEMTLHKQCTDEMTEVCAGKGGKKKPRINLPIRNPRKPSNPNQPEAGVRPHSVIHSPIEQLVQPLPKSDDSDLASALCLIAGLPTGHSVKTIIDRYQEMSSPTGVAPPSGLPTGNPSSSSLSSNEESGRKGSIIRTGSLNNKGENQDRPVTTRRAKSDVDVDPDAIHATVNNKSGSSSTSSMSNRSEGSPSNSTDNVHEMLISQQEDPDKELPSELPPLRQVLGDEVYRKLKPKEKKRQDVLNELIYTERAHLRNLKILDNVFNKPMSHHELARALFPNLEEMILLHESLTIALREKQKAHPVVKEVGDVLLKRFDGESGETFRKGCAEYCRNQSYTLDALKKTTRKDAKLAQFLTDAETNPLCRRLHLKDLLLSQVHRLTKYPLLIDSLLKYTPASSEEHRRLERALERSRHILAYVNQAVKECDNYHRLKEIQKKLDKRLADTNDPARADIQALDLTKGHKLIYDGPLTMKLRTNRNIDLHVLLFDDLLVMLQKQDDRYLLKYQNSNAPSVRDSSFKEERYTHSPVLYVRNILARHVATDKKEFFVVNVSESRAQMYQFIAATPDSRIKWCDIINEQNEAIKKAGKGESTSIPPPPYDDIDLEQPPVSGPRTSDISVDDDDDDDDDHTSLDGVDGLSRPSVTDPITDTDLIQPEEVSVKSVITAQAMPVRTTEELLRKNTNDIAVALKERHRLMEQVLYKSDSLAGSCDTPHWDLQEDEDVAFGPEQLEPETASSEEDGRHPDDNNNLERTLLARAVLKCNEFIQLVAKTSEEAVLQQLERQHDAKRQEGDSLTDSQTKPTTSERDSVCSSSVSSPPPQTPASPPEASQSLQPTQKGQATVTLPMEQLKGMAVEMNAILSKLMSTMNTGGEERQRWREEIQEAQRKLNALKEQQRQLTLSGAVPPDRDPASYDEEMDSSQASPPTAGQAPFSSLSPTLAPSQISSRQVELSAEETILVSEEEEMHHGVQEAIMDESVETLVSRPSTEIAGVKVTEVSMGDEEEEDDDEDNEVSVRDLPLPDIGTIQATAGIGIEPQPLRSPRLLDGVELDNSDDEDDDNDTLVSKGEHPDLSSLSSMSTEGAHPADASGTDSWAGPQNWGESSSSSCADDGSHCASESKEEGSSVDDDDSKDDECTPVEI